VPDTVQEEEVRAGSRALALFANPINARVLRAHLGGPLRLSDVQDAIGWSAESTVRAAISNLCELGALEKQRLGESSRAVATALNEVGREFIFVADELESWLSRNPAGPIPPDSEGAKRAVKALASGWNSTLVHELANHPVTLTELNKAIPEFSYPVLERRISWMRMTGQIEPRKKEGRGTPYVVTDWLRHAIAPIAASGRCEQRHMDPLEVPIPDAEVETGFLIATPLGPLPDHASGTCLLAAQTGGLAGPTDAVETAEDLHLAGVTVEVETGQILSCSPFDPDSRPPTWTVGPLDAWLDAVIDGTITDLRIGGDNPQLALDLVAGLHLALFVDR
jgi:DNA-binding HxlR family transcriptional regulator